MPSQHRGDEQQEPDLATGGPRGEHGGGGDDTRGKIGL